MKSIEAVKTLHSWDKQGLYLFDVNALSLAFDETGNTLRSTIKRLLADGLLVRVARGLYAYALSYRIGPTTIYDVACALRPGELVYESFESAGSQWGFISQIPIDRVTVATTGAGGEFSTPYGVVEYGHVNRGAAEIADGVASRMPHNPLPIASRQMALEDMLVGKERCTELIDWEALDDD